MSFFNSEEQQPLAMKMHHRLREGLLLLTFAFSVFVFISLASYHQGDPGWSSSGMGEAIYNWGGRVGAWFADVFLSLFGVTAYLFPILIIFSGWLRYKSFDCQMLKTKRERLFKLLGWTLFVVSACALAGFYMSVSPHLPAAAGGIVGDIVGNGLSHVLNRTGSSLLFLTTLLCGVTIVTGLSWIGLLEWVARAAVFAVKMVYAYLKRPKQIVPQVIEENHMPVRAEPVLIERAETDALATLAPTIHKEEVTKARKKFALDPNIRMAPGTLPPLSLLNPAPPALEKAFANLSFEELSILVEQRLAEFGVEVRVVAVHPGPVITRFELDLAPGLKVSKITGLAKDIARSLSVVSVRVVEVIPGKSVIGLEMPNENRELVTLREVLETPRYAQSRSPVSLVLGKDTSGHPVVVDLEKMPHLLVAGTTGSGKSVSLNAMLLSMLYKASPKELRLILIDPKMLELSIYDGIPHLLTPVITDMKDAANALRWCVAEMDKRYRLMAALGVRNLTTYNQKVSDAIKQGEPLPMPGVLVNSEETAKMTLEPLPIVVVVADELADMMMVVGKKVEELIARIAQKARAAGIHLILATQRPSVDVITGLIKANIPTRVAFQVSSRIDSRTILDQQGAEQLLGHGDMLYLPPGVGVPIRVHGAYVADDEVHRVVAAWRSVGEPEYLDGITTEALEAGQGEAEGGEKDPLFDEAVRIVTDSKRASISLVQRRLRIGYNRAARMMEEMEMAGVVSTPDGNGLREVLALAAPAD